MSAFDRFDRNFAEALAHLAGPRTPDYIDDVLERAVSRRQRPAWTFPERWLPMGVLARRPAFAPALPWRTIGLLIIMALLLAALFAIGLGALLQRTAPPYGVAENGVVVYSDDGDIYARDPSTGAATLLVGGPEIDVGPWFSRDGRRFSFVRLVSQQPEMIAVMVANADGSNAHAVVEPERADQSHWAEWSPQGDHLIIHNGADGVPQLSLVNVEGQPQRRAIELPVDVEVVDWRPGTDELIFRGREPDAAPRAWGFYAVRSDGTGLRQLVPPPGFEGTHFGPFGLSHDGRLLAYTSAERLGNLGISILDLENGDTRSLRGSGTQGWATFSPNGEHIAFIRYSDPAGSDIAAQAFIGSVTGDGTDAVAIGPEVRVQQNTPGLRIQFSPDGSSLLINHAAGDGAWLADVASGDHESVQLGDDEWVSWQRRAP